MRRQNRWLASLLLAMAALHAAAQEALPFAAAAAADSALYLDVSVNGRPSGMIMRFNGAAGSLRTEAGNLRRLGVASAGLHGEDAREVALDAIPGLRYAIDSGAQSLALQLDDAARAAFQLGARSAAPAPTTASAGAVFSYDTLVQLGAQRGVLLSGELRLFNQAGLFSTTGMASTSGGRRKSVRYESYWQETDAATLRSFQLGDMITSSLSWSRPVRIGGVQWRKNFALRPDLLTFPTATVNGSALVPSALSLYVNGVQQFSSEVPDGPFELAQVAGINGAGEASVVTRDALGRATVTSLPLYVDIRMLAPGLFDYSVELGALRRNFGIRSFDYARSPALSASGRYGLNALLTLEGHAEAGKGIVNGGGSVLAQLGRFGVLNATLAASGGRQRGAQAGLGYQYLGPRFSIDAYSAATRRDYGDLASREGAPAPRRSRRLSLTMSLPGQQSLSLSHVFLDTAPGAPASIASLAYGATLERRVFLSISPYRDARRRGSGGVFASLSFAFGDRTSGGVGGGRQSGIRQRSANLMRAPDFGGGVGWSLQAGQLGEGSYGQAQLRYLGPYGQVGASALRSGDSTAGLLEASGSLVAMDGAFAPARQVGSGFAVVSTGAPNVPVMHENRVIGVTGASGHLLVPNLNPYANNRLGIDVTGLPLDARVRRSSMDVAPRSLAGVLVKLPVERYRAASVILLRADGTLLAAGTPVRHRESGAETLVGHDGIAFIDELREQNTLDAGEGEQRCSARFAYLPADGAALPTIGPVLCGSAP